jgi:hypothetical protein
MARLHAIIYVSSAVHLPAPHEIEYLLQRARERNARAGVTGLLLHDAGHFMQYLEGPPDALLAIYDIVLADPLHHRVRELMSESIGEREFDGWAMAYEQAALPAFLARPHAEHALKAQAQLLLHDVWASHSHHH